MQAEKQKTTEYLSSFAYRLRGLLERNHMTQRDLADHLNVGVSRVGQWCQGRNMPKKDMQKRIAETLDVSWEYLIQGKPGYGQEKTEATRVAEKNREPQGMYRMTPDLMRINKGYQLPPKVATIGDLEAFLMPWLDAAKHNPNVAPHVLTLLKKHLPHADLNLFKAEDT